MLTLRHPAVSGSTDEGKLALYRAKEAETVRRVGDLFRAFDATGTGVLKDSDLRGALASIGVRPDDHQVAGILQRHAVHEDGLIWKEQFAGVVQEAWGRTKQVAFDDRLTDIHRGLPDHAPLEGKRVLLWLGRESPVHWAMRLLRHAWPFAVKRVVIMRNCTQNADMDPQHMEAYFEWVHQSSQPGVLNAADLAQHAAAQPPHAKGGFSVRLDPFEPNASSIYVPLRGLPKNRAKGLGLVTSFFRGFLG